MMARPEPARAFEKPFEPKTTAQNRKIWALKAELFLDTENLRDIVAQVTKERSISRLSMHQASQVIKLLEKYQRRQKGREKTARKVDRQQGKVLLLVNPKQRAMLRMMASKVEWRYEDGFQRFLKTRLNLEAVKTNDDVTMVKQALQNIIDCQKKSREVAQPQEIET